WQVGRYTATLTVARPQPGQAMHATVEWAPGLPAALSALELQAYRAGRAIAVAELSKSLGITVAVVDL
ncbi:MAG TPA: hypothetical protein VNV16_09810, partial [Methylibium sp.]|nr:hypothetical protein [Methylibium sp.]